MVLRQMTDVEQSVCPCVDLLTARQRWIIARDRSLVYIDQLPNSSLVKTMVKHLFRYFFFWLRKCIQVGFRRMKLITDIDICNLRLGGKALYPAANVF